MSMKSAFAGLAMLLLGACSGTDRPPPPPPYQPHVALPPDPGRCRDDAATVPRDFAHIELNPSEQALQRLLNVIDRARQCVAESKLRGKDIQDTLLLGRRVLVSWYTRDPEKRGEGLFFSSPPAHQFGKRYLSLYQAVGMTAEPAVEQLGAHMFLVDALAGDLRDRLSKPFTKPSSSSRATTERDLQDAAARLRSALLGEVTSWRGLPSATSGLKDASYAGSGKVAGKAVKLTTRLTWVSSYFEKLSDLWGDRDISGLRSALGRPYYDYLTALIGDGQASTGTVSSGTPALGISQWLVPLDGTPRGVVKLSVIREHIKAYDDHNLRGLFEMRRAAKRWRELVRRENVTEDDLGEAVSSLAKAMKHTENHEVQATELANLTVELDILDQSPIQDGPSPKGTKDAERAAASLVRRKLVSRRYAEAALCLLNSALLYGHDRACDGRAPPPNLPCTPLPMRKGVLVEGLGEAYGKLVGALSVDMKASLTPRTRCELQRGLHREVFVALEPSVLRYHQALSFVTAKNGLAAGNDAVGALLSGLVIQARRTRDNACALARASVDCTFAQIDQILTRPTTAADAIAIAKRLGAEFCDAGTLVSSTLEMVTKMGLDEDAANHLSPLNKQDLRNAKVSFGSAVVGCPKPGEKSRSSKQNKKRKVGGKSSSRGGLRPTPARAAPPPLARRGTPTVRRAVSLR